MEQGGERDQQRSCWRDIKEHEGFRVSCPENQGKTNTRQTVLELPKTTKARAAREGVLKPGLIYTTMSPIPFFLSV